MPLRYILLANCDSMFMIFFFFVCITFYTKIIILGIYPVHTCPSHTLIYTCSYVFDQTYFFFLRSYLLIHFRMSEALLYGFSLTSFDLLVEFKYQSGLQHQSELKDNFCNKQGYFFFQCTFSDHVFDVFFVRYRSHLEDTGLVRGG